MTEILIIASRYIFMIFAMLFVWESILYVLFERGIRPGNILGPIRRQRLLMTVFFLLGFFILVAKDSETSIELAIETLKLAGVVLIFMIFMFVSSKSLFRDSCPLLWNGVFFLFLTGILVLQRLNPERAKRQLFFASLGYLVSLFIPIVLRIIKDFGKLTWLYYGIALGLLGSLFIFGSKTYGATNWIKMGPISFQPSEFAKFFYCLFLAGAFKNKEKFRDIIVPSVAAAGIILLLVIQNDLGGALLFFIIFLLVFYVATGYHTLSFGAIILFIGAVFLSYRLFPHVTRRFDSWLNPWADPYNKSFQVVQSLFALSSFGFWGIGLTRGIPLDIPFVDTDFAFAAIGEELGALYGLFVIGLFILVFYRGVNIALRHAEIEGNTFYALLSVGIVGALSVQSFVILGGVTGLIPITGVTLPFISYGGSSIFISFILIGLLQWLHREKGAGIYEEKKKDNPNVYS